MEIITLIISYFLFISPVIVFIFWVYYTLKNRNRPSNRSRSAWWRE